MKIKIILLFFFGMFNAFSQDANDSIADKNSNDGIFAEFETSKGNIVAKLDYKMAPVTVANFITLTEGTNKYVTDEKLKEKPFYDDLKFHIVIKDYMIKSGDPTGMNTGGPGYSIKGEFAREMIFNKEGILAMDNSETSGMTIGSQFFITHRETLWYSGEKTIFGYVLSGLDVVKAIEQNDKLIKVTIKRVGPEAESFDAIQTLDKYFTIKKPIEDQEEAIKKQKIEAQKAEAKSKKEKTDAEAQIITTEKEKEGKAAKIKYFTEMKAKTIKTPSGLKYVIIKKGAGKKPVAGQNIYIHYSQYREDGSLDGTNCEDVAKLYGRYNEKAPQKSYEPFPYVIGQKEALLPGIMEGLKKMNLGDTILLYIPSKLAYGTQGNGNIKPNTNLIFEIETVPSIPKH